MSGPDRIARCGQAGFNAMPLNVQWEGLRPKYHSEHTHMLYIDQEALLICIVYLFVDCILAHSGGFKHATT